MRSEEGAGFNQAQQQWEENRGRRDALQKEAERDRAEDLAALALYEAADARVRAWIDAEVEKRLGGARLLREAKRDWYRRLVCREWKRGRLVPPPPPDDEHDAWEAGRE